MSRIFTEKVKGIAKRFGFWLPGVILFTSFFFLRKYFEDCASVRALLEHSGWFAPLVYLGISTLAMTVLIPRTFFVILAGVCFGNYVGTLLVTISSMSAAVLAFLISRYAARARFENLLRKRKWFFQLEMAAAESGLSLVILTRAIHVIHFGLSNYAFGLLPISLMHFIIGTFLGLLPGSIALVYGGNTFGCALLERGFDFPPAIKERLIIATVLLTISSLVPLVWHMRQQKQKMSKKKPSGS